MSKLLRLLFPWWKCLGPAEENDALVVHPNSNSLDVDSILHENLDLRTQIAKLKEENRMILAKVEALKRDKENAEAKRDADVLEETPKRYFVDRCQFPELISAVDQLTTSVDELQKERLRHRVLRSCFDRAMRQLDIPENPELQQRDEVAKVFEKLNRPLGYTKLELDELLDKLLLLQQIEIVRLVKTRIRRETPISRKKLLLFFGKQEEQIELARSELNQHTEKPVYTELSSRLENAITQFAVIVAYLDPDKTYFNQAFSEPDWPFGIVPFD